jgi:hypothetical protein
VVYFSHYGPPCTTTPHFRILAFVVQTQPGRFEVRESRSTPQGPRSRTLASFREFDDGVLEKVQARAEKPPAAAELRDAAVRAGAPVAEPPLDEAAREVLRRMAKGERLNPMLRRFLLDALENGGRAENSRRAMPISDAARSATEWIGVDAEARSDVLRDLLELADALPIRPRTEEIGYPRLESS